MNPPSIDELVNRQVRKWQFQKARRAQMTDPRILPVITVSRQLGVQASRLGQSIAERLGYDFWDHKILDAMAEHAHLSVALLESLDEHPKTVVAEALARFLATAGTNTSDYMRELVRHVHTIAHHGGAVIIGRGAQFILSPTVALRVRVVAPVEHRASQLAACESIDIHDARKEITRVDAERAAFAREHWSQDIDDPRNYDIVANIQELAIGSVLEMIVAAYRHHFGT